ncbi:MAG: hypothetical protein HY700_20835 [Gemmatimonadetes bacterium]|nr:hypothetical protein [Gemmatimonadota bacterium]
MPRLTGRSVTVIAALVACLVYANSLRNGWAGDDPLVIVQNARTHSVAAAIYARFLPYWPPPWQGAGTYRPLTILTYGLNWPMADGRPWVFHLTNVLIHAAATALLVRIALLWLLPAGALAAGILFAVHPVHVEAVSNVVGRAELLVAAGLFAAVLAARRYRQAGGRRGAQGWLAVTLAVVAMSLLSKEHGVIAVAVLAVDHLLDRRPAPQSMTPLYLGVTAVTLTWFYLWKSVAGLYVAGGATTAMYGMSTTERWMTMLPVQLDVLRLLVWPLDLSSDYSQQTVSLQSHLTAAGVIGLAAMASVVALGLLLARRLPAVAFGILIAAGSYAPTSNFFFMSGVVLAERALYIAVIAPAFVLGWAVDRSLQRPYRNLLLVALGLALLVFTVESWTRTPFWQTPQTTIIEDAGDHPENYRVRLHLADLIASKGDTARALAEYLAAETLAERDPFLALFVVNSAIALRRYDLAIERAQRAHQLAPNDARPLRWLVQAALAAGRGNAAVATALDAAIAHPTSAGHVGAYVMALEHTAAPPVRRLLAAATADWLTGHLVQSSARLDSASVELGRLRGAPIVCQEMVVLRGTLEGLRPSLVERLLVKMRDGGLDCGSSLGKVG